jgi:hypothetical protein
MQFNMEIVCIAWTCEMGPSDESAIGDRTQREKGRSRHARLVGFATGQVERRMQGELGDDSCACGDKEQDVRVDVLSGEMTGPALGQTGKP